MFPYFIFQTFSWNVNNKALNIFNIFYWGKVIKYWGKADDWNKKPKKNIHAHLLLFFILIT